MGHSSEIMARSVPSGENFASLAFHDGLSPFHDGPSPFHDGPFFGGSRTSLHSQVRASQTRTTWTLSCAMVAIVLLSGEKSMKKISSFARPRSSWLCFVFFVVISWTWMVPSLHPIARKFPFGENFRVESFLPWLDESSSPESVASQKRLTPSAVETRSASPGSNSGGVYVIQDIKQFSVPWRGGRYHI